MRRILGLIGTLAVISVSSSVLEAQAGKITVKGGIVAKQPVDCDALCQLEGKVNGLATRLAEAEKENARLKGSLEQNEKQTAVNSLKIIGLEGNLKTEAASRDAQVSDEDKKIGEYAYRITALEGTAKEYKSHTHTLPAGFGLTKQGNFNMVIVTSSNVFSRPTSGPEQH